MTLSKPRFVETVLGPCLALAIFTFASPARAEDGDRMLYRIHLCESYVPMAVSVRRTHLPRPMPEIGHCRLV